MCVKNLQGAIFEKGCGNNFKLIGVPDGREFLLSARTAETCGGTVGERRALYSIKPHIYICSYTVFERI